MLRLLSIEHPFGVTLRLNSFTIVRLIACLSGARYAMLSSRPVLRANRQ